MRCLTDSPLAMPPLRPERDVYTVSRLNREVRILLEQGMPLLWVEGEISNLARPASGHWYFSLKDRDAQVRCVMFRQRTMGLRFTPRDGLAVIARARVGLYEPRGDYQLIVEQLEEAGDGALRREFEQLRDRLEREGLFAAERKRPLPRLPRRIGIVTSPTGAAIRDVLHVLGRRFRAIPVVIYPSAVQGAQAVPALLAALERAAYRAECDVLIVARGGGSLEDLWAFNDERVARALAAMPMPVVTGIGHEVDFTIADFVADLRAPTPSGAAERVVPDAREWLAGLAQLARRLRLAMARTLREQVQGVESLAHRLRRVHPSTRIDSGMQRLDELEQRLRQGLRLRLGRRELALRQLESRLARCAPATRLRELGLRELGLRKRLEHAMSARLGAASARFAVARSALSAVSPLATLERGYAIVTRLRDGQLVADAAAVAVGDQIEARLGRGRLRARVSATHEPAS
jgi:exodeoxyribonuclease VII large subunit